MNRVGIDVSNEVFDACLKDAKGLCAQQFPNTRAGHRRAIQWMTRGRTSARVCLEATGVYHLQLALALHAHPDVEVMVANPRAVRRFIEAQMIRAKTDAADAYGVLLYLEGMTFKPWAAPSDIVLELQYLARRLGQLTKEQTRERCRVHAARRAGPQGSYARRDIEHHLHYLKKRIDVIKRQAVKLLQTDPCLAEDLSIVKTATGFAQLSATKLIAELSPLAADLTPRQWVAQSGLDPRPRESGSSVHPPRRISKNGNPRIREALFMPALTAIRSDPNVNAFYNSLLARGKQKMQAVTAVMRKLLHALWGMLHHRQTWDGSKFYGFGLTPNRVSTIVTEYSHDLDPKPPVDDPLWERLPAAIRVPGAAQNAMICRNCNDASRLGGLYARPVISRRPHSRNLRTSRYSQSGMYYFLTTSVAGRRRLFTQRDHAEVVLETIRWLHRVRRYIVDAAVVMPDHLHLAGQLGDSSLSKVMHTLKSYSANRLAEAGVDTPVWQTGYHDHALRGDEDYRIKVRYLIENPLRAGLVEQIDDYPYLILPTWWRNR